ncbi:MAG: ABC transporter substrate-binding protein [Actinomycetia bacterium]|nr:ABC transporter substrate-binding protein [Actinomycetes bacterium]
MKKIMVLLMSLIITAVMGAACNNDGNAKMGGMVNSDAAETREDEVHNLLIEGDGFPYTITDYMNNIIVIEDKPENWAVLSGTFLNLWYKIGGTSICTTDLGSVKLDPENREEIERLPSVGPVYNPNTEKVVEIFPDFVIAQTGIQTSLANILNSMGITTALFHMKSYKDVLDHMRVFGKLLEKEDYVEELIAKMEDDKKAIIDKLPEENKTIVILYITSASLSVKLDNSIAGDVAKLLSIDNIASDLPPDTIGSETTPIDIEFIAEMNPDMVLVASMISSNEDAKRVMNEEFDTNPVWESVGAVTEGNVAFLPQEYFLYNAGHNYVRAIEYMAKAVYPEIYGEIDG